MVCLASSIISLWFACIGKRFLLHGMVCHEILHYLAFLLEHRKEMSREPQKAEELSNTCLEQPFLHTRGSRSLFVKDKEWN